MKGKPETLLGSARSLAVALFVALLFRSTCVQAFSIPTGSATPTLQTGDTVLVSKFAYGYSRYSLPIAPAFLHGRLFGRDPARGDMAVFVNPHDGVVTLKRIVGLPGDTIEVRHGILVLNGVASLREPDGTFLERDLDEDGSLPVESLRRRYVETMPNGVRHAILGTPVWAPEDSGPVDTTGIYTVPAGQFFGMGDSRDNSADSRFVDELGFIPAENLIGRADFRVMSMQPGAHFWQVWTWPTAMRWERFFGRIT